MTNIVLVTVDCLRYDRCGFNGHHRNTTPNLDAIATHSTVFDRCYSTGPYTTESFPGILAGQHSYNGYQYGDNPGYKAIPAKSPTLASEFSDNDYRTAAVISNPHLTTNRNFDKGFDVFENFRAELGDDHDEDDSGLALGSYFYDVRERMRRRRSRYNPLAGVYTLYRYSQHRTGWPTTDGAELTDRSIEVLDELSGDGDPFFFWTHFMDVHAPISPTRANSTDLNEIPVLRSLFWDASRAGRFYEPRYEALYDSAVRYVDSQIGRLIAHLRQLGEWKDTVLIVTGDHGEVLFDRESVYGHPPHYHYDDLLHVPLLVSGSETEPDRVDTPVSLAWLHEICSEVSGADLSGFPASSGVESVLDGDSSGSPVVSDTFNERGHTVSVRDTDEKVIAHQSSGTDQICWDYRDQPIGFRYRLDRGERKPLSEPPTVLETTAKEYHVSETKLPEVRGDFSRSTEQRLQDLGYKM